MQVYSRYTAAFQGLWKLNSSWWLGGRTKIWSTIKLVVSLLSFSSNIPGSTVSNTKPECGHLHRQRELQEKLSNSGSKRREESPNPQSGGILPPHTHTLTFLQPFIPQPLRNLTMAVAVAATVVTTGLQDSEGGTMILRGWDKPPLLFVFSVFFYW